MKKLLVLALVLVVSTMASAVVVSIDGPATLNTGEAATFYINVDSAIGAIDIDFGVDSGLATISDVLIIAAGRDTGLDYIDSEYAGYDYEAAAATGVGGSMTGSVISFTVTAGLVEGDFGFLADLYDLQDTSGVGVAGSISSGTVSIVPEPITVALLGLGGLFIRRRK